MDREEIQKEFKNNPELAGDFGYCNPIMAEKIADWWLNKFDQHLLTLRRKIEEMRQFVGENGKTYYDEVEKIGYNTAIRDILSLSELQVREQ